MSNEVYTTPAGVALYPYLSRPDTQFDAHGVYKVDLAIPPDIAEDLVAQLERVQEEFVATLTAAERAKYEPHPVFLYEETRPEFPEGISDEQKRDIKANFVPEKTGNLMFRMKMKAHVDLKDGSSFDQKPVIVSAEDGSAVEDPVYDGSVIRCKGQLVPYKRATDKKYGVTMRLKSVQVIDLVTGSGGNDTDWTAF